MSYLVAKGLPHTVLYLVLLYYQEVGQEVVAMVITFIATLYTRGMAIR